MLDRKVLEDGIDIRSPEAPRSVRDALDRYFSDHRNWDLSDARRRQARELQIVASGPRRDTSLLIYDDGVGQVPADFGQPGRASRREKVSQEGEIQGVRDTINKK